MRVFFATTTVLLLTAGGALAEDEVNPVHPYYGHFTGGPAMLDVGPRAHLDASPAYYHSGNMHANWSGWSGGCGYGLWDDYCHGCRRAGLFNWCGHPGQGHGCRGRMFGFHGWHGCGDGCGDCQPCGADCNPCGKKLLNFNFNRCKKMFKRDCGCDHCHKCNGCHYGHGDAVLEVEGSEEDVHDAPPTPPAPSEPTAGPLSGLRKFIPASWTD